MKRGFNNAMSRGRSVFGIAYIPVHSAALPVLIVMLMTALGVRMSEPALNLTCYGVSFFAVLIVMWGFLRQSFSDFFDDVFRSVTSVGWGLLMNYGWSVIAGMIVYGLMGDGASNPNQEQIVEQVKSGAYIMRVVAVAFAPVIEEALFRGALFGAIRTKSRVAAYAVSMAAFALYHVWAYMLFGGRGAENLIYALQYLPAGFALAWSYERSGSIWAPVLLHMVTNAVGMAAIS